MMAGFRESGVVNVARAGLPMVAVRSMGLGFDSIIGYQDAAGKVVCVVDASYLSSVMQIAKERFKTNTARTKRFQDNLENAYKADREGGSADGIASAKALRRQRKREEGLAIQEEARKVESDRSVGDDTAGTADLAGLFD
jgi:tRNA wybutosine-synthesizing protein 3